MKKILIIDVCSDKNSGDASMQLALRDLIDDIIPENKLLISTRFGSNQNEFAIEQLQTFSNSPHAEIIPGSYPTYVNQSPNEGGFSLFLRKLRKLLAAVYIAPLLIALSMNFDWLANKLANWQNKLPTNKTGDVDFIIWNGRNFRKLDGLRGLVKLSELLANPAIISCHHAPKVIYGVSFWPVRSKIALWLVNGIMSKYDHIYVRESESLRLGQAMGLKNIQMQPDLSFYHLTKLHNARSVTLQPLATRDNIAAFTLVAPRELVGIIDFGDYIKLIVSAIKHIRKNHNLSVVIVRQVTFGPEVEDETIQCVQKHCGPIEVMAAPQNIDELLDIYSNSRILVATRMHSAIFAISCGTPVVTLPYDWKGKWQILADLGVPQSCMNPLISAKTRGVIEGIDIAVSGKNDWSSMANLLHQEGINLKEMVSNDFAQLKQIKKLWYNNLH